MVGTVPPETYTVTIEPVSAPESTDPAERDAITAPGCTDPAENGVISAPASTETANIVPDDNTHQQPDVPNRDADTPELDEMVAETKGDVDQAPSAGAQVPPVDADLDFRATGHTAVAWPSQTLVYYACV